ncbi:hypothetical protein JCM10908_005116 [Rhodotorula pacifica]|uniref:Hsp20/alpha crystallin family protein n=1 Tax=Rhodotorula pacifica TaxID=1495444 RepID=UPI00317BA0AC
MDRVTHVDYGTGIEDRFVGLGLGEAASSSSLRQAAPSPPISTTDQGISYPPSTVVASSSPSSSLYGVTTRGPIGINKGHHHHHLRSNSRPHSTDAHSSHSSGDRSWVLDSDASSICSMTSSSSPDGSGGNSAARKAYAGRSVVVYEDGTEEIFEEGGEVYRPESDGGDLDFLDHRSEPPETSLQVDRSDPSQVLLRVTLPGFSLDNITVAMRRGKKVHIVADSYGENGGHYERLVFLGSDISSSAPRAEFDGRLLKIHIQRRPSRPSSSAGSAHPRPSSRSSSVFSSPELDRPHQLPDWRNSVASIWSSGSLSPPTAVSFPTSRHGSIPSGAPLSPPLAEAFIGHPFEPATEEGLVSPSDLNGAELPPPCTARASPPPDGVRRAVCVTGPEGARRAARAAREAATRRAKEEAKRLDLRDGVTVSGRVREPFRKRTDESSPSDSGTGGDSDIGGSNTSSSGEASWPGISPTTSISTDQSCDPLSLDSSYSSISSAPGPSVDRNRTIRGYPHAPPFVRDTYSPEQYAKKGEEQRSATGRTLDSASVQLEDEIASGSDLKSTSSVQGSQDKVLSSVTTASQAGIPGSGSHLARPRMPDSSPTFRAHGHATSFAEAIAAQHGYDGGPSSPPTSSDGENRTPRHEVPGLDFAVAHTPRI